ncbi:MAG: SHOCT domain-containing protein [Candidatus Paceibacterota bacterium]|jgi:putative membrane protein
MMYGLNGDYGGWFGGGLMMILFWAAVIIFIVWLVREVGGRNHEKTSSNSALEILKERYAKGEINKEEFEAKKKDIVSS